MFYKVHVPHAVKILAIGCGHLRIDLMLKQVSLHSESQWVYLLSVVETNWDMESVHGVVQEVVLHSLVMW